MPTPLPTPGTENLELPELDEINFVALGIRSGCIDGPRLTDLQLTVLDALTESMTGVKVDLDVFEPVGEPEFLATNWWSFADTPIDVVRAHFNVVPKSECAIAAGSVSPWEPGGISPFQDVAGRELAQTEGREYNSFGASLL